MKKNSTNKLEVKGNMSPEGADKAGYIQAIAVVIGVTLFGIAAILAAVNI